MHTLNLLNGSVPNAMLRPHPCPIPRKGQPSSQRKVYIDKVDLVEDQLDWTELRLTSGGKTKWTLRFALHHYRTPIRLWQIIKGRSRKNSCWHPISEALAHKTLGEYSFDFKVLSNEGTVK